MIKLTEEEQAAAFASFGIGGWTIDKIDTSKPLGFRGSRPDCSNTHNFEITPAEGRVLIDYLAQCCWREDFEKNLSLIVIGEVIGEPKLTGWMPLDVFEEFLSVTAPLKPDFPISDLCAKLLKMTSDWRGMGVQEVFFEGMRR